MPYKTVPCPSADLHLAFVLVSETFQHTQPYHDAIYPYHWTASGRDDGARRFLESLESQSHIRYLKSVEEATGELAGLVRYYVYEEGEGVEELGDELGGEWWVNEEEKAYARHLYRNYLETRFATIRAVKGAVVCLDLLTVHPKHQSQGAGTALVRWGTDLADRMGAEMTVESSLLGLEVYKKNGFRIVEERTLTVPTKWEARPKTNFWFMRRGLPQHKEWTDIRARPSKGFAAPVLDH